MSVKHLPFALLLALLPACKRSEPAAEAPAPPSQPSSVQEKSAPAQTATASSYGETLFQQQCATCHMANGSGVPYLQPDIRRSAWISAEDPQPLLKLILRGSAAMGEFAKTYENDMPPFEHLSDADIAAIATRVREKFSQPPPTKPVTPADVATARSQ